MVDNTSSKQKLAAFDGPFRETCDALQTLHDVESEFQINDAVLNMALVVVFGLRSFGENAPKVWSHGNKSVVLEVPDCQIGIPSNLITVSERGISIEKSADETSGNLPDYVRRVEQCVIGADVEPLTHDWARIRFDLHELQRLRSSVEPKCSTCGRTKDDPDALICSNSFHLPEKS
jgi:hypothetical protein